MSVVNLEQRITALDARYPFGVTVFFTFLGILIASLPNLADPFLRQDDFPALLLYPEYFYGKTLSEGRWINFLWHLRPIETPSWLNLQVYYLFAAILCAGLAVNALGRESGLWYRAGLAVFAWLGAPTFLISLWFNVLTPGVGLMALYAWLATVCTERQTRLLLLIFVPLTLMTYTTYPLVLLIICLTRHDTRRSFSDGLRLMLLFLASFVLGLLVIYALNYYEHGIFGIRLSSWRGGNTLEDWESFRANLGRMQQFGHRLTHTLGYASTLVSALHLLLFPLAVYFVTRQDFWRGMYIFVGMLAGLGLLSVQVVISGTELPFRTFGFGWMLYGIVLVLFVLTVVERGGQFRRHGINFLRFMVMLLMMQVFLQQLGYRPWQNDTKELAHRIGKGEEPVFLIGIHKDLPSWETAGIQYAYGLRFRLQMLTRRRVYMCTDLPITNDPDLCPKLDPMVEEERRLVGKSIVEHLSDYVLVILPYRDPEGGEEDQVRGGKDEKNNR